MSLMEGNLVLMSAFVTRTYNFNLMQRFQLPKCRKWKGTVDFFTSLTSDMPQNKAAVLNVSGVKI